MRAENKPLTPEERLLVLGARIRPDAEEAAEMKDVLQEDLRWEALMRDGDRLGVHALLYRHLSSPPFVAPVPRHVIETLKNVYRLQSLRNLKIYGQVGRLLGAFQDEAVPVVLLKGAHLAWWVYGDIGLRPLSDIDILCRHEEEERACGVMHRLGYGQKEAHPQSALHERLTWAGTSHLPPFWKPGCVSVDLHLDLYPRASRGRDHMKGIWERTCVRNIDGRNAGTLSPEDNILFLAHHLAKHLAVSRVRLTWFCDIREAILLSGRAMDWETLFARAGGLEVAADVGPIFQLLERHWKTPIGTTGPSGSSDRLSITDIMAPGRENGVRLRARAALVRRVARSAGRPAAALFLFKHLFPAPRHLIHRYDLDRPWKVVLFYCIHPYRLLKRAAKGGAHIVRAKLHKRLRGRIMGHR